MNKSTAIIIAGAVFILVLVPTRGHAYAREVRHFDKITENMICDQARAMTPAQRAAAVVTMRITSAEQQRIRRQCGI